MIEDLQKLGIDLKGRISGNHKLICPKCSQDRKKKNDPCLSVNITEGVYNCHNCGWKGTVKKIEKTGEKNYIVPQINNTDLSDKTLSWFLKRQISKATVMRYKITESKEFMPQVSEERNCINFNYFRDDQLVNVKFRDAQKNFKMIPKAEMIFYGLDFIKDHPEVVICEGEMDALSFYEAGIFYVISVPNGASKGNQKLEYLNNCWSYFDDKTKIIIATDSDGPGVILRDELSRRLGQERCLYVSYPEGCKDANDVLMKHGPEAVRKLVDEAAEFPIEGIKTVADLNDRINDLYINGYPKGHIIGYEEFDKLMSWRQGEVTAVTGIPNSGKSEFIDQVIVKLAEAHEWKWALFSAENQPEEIHFAKLSEKYIGKSFHAFNDEYKMTLDDLQNAKSFINERFFFINIDEKNITLDGLLDKGRELILKKGVNGFLIDPWNYIEHKIPKGNSETQYISEALTKISRFAKVNKVHMIVVAHPVKIAKEADGKYKVATMYDIAGSANWFNKIDNGLSIYRDYDTGIVDVYVQKIRFKFIGKIGRAGFQWDKFTGKYNEISN
jgi:twinkle protein